MPESKDAIVGGQLSMARVSVLLLTGEREAALAEIERLAVVNAGFTRWDLEMPAFDPLLEEPRFQTVLARLRGR